MRVLHMASLCKGVQVDDIQYHFSVTGDGTYVDESEVRLEPIHGGAAVAALLCVDDHRAATILATGVGEMRDIALPGAKIRVHRHERATTWLQEHKEPERRPCKCSNKGSTFWAQYLERRGGRKWQPCDKWVRSVRSMRCSVDEIAMGMFSDGERIVRMAVE